MGSLERLDWVVVGLYFIAVFGVAGWAAWQARSGRQSSAG